MPTTFQSRELVRDELVALFTANGNWQNVYGYVPAVSAFESKYPILLIRGRGTEQRLNNQDNNPALYRMVLINYVLADSAGGITSATAEDELDRLDKIIRQVIRDNAGSLTTADNLYFDGSSEVIDVKVGNVPYIQEIYTVMAHLSSGSKP